MEHLKYISTDTGRWSSSYGTGALEYLSLYIVEGMIGDYTHRYTRIDLATKEPTSKSEINKLKKQQRENLNPRTRKNSRWC